MAAGTAEIAEKGYSDDPFVVICETRLVVASHPAGEISVREFLTSIASGEGTQDAVSAAAVVGGIGTGLLLMVAALPKMRTTSTDDHRLLMETASALEQVQKELVETVDTATAVRIFAARNMPQGSVSQRRERDAAIQIALRAAADVPLEVMRLCGDGLNHAQVIARCHGRVASANVHLAVALLHAAFNGARANLESKLSSLTDTRYVASVVDEIAQLSEEARTAVRAAESYLQIPPA